MTVVCEIRDGRARKNRILYASDVIRNIILTFHKTDLVKHTEAFRQEGRLPIQEQFIIQSISVKDLAELDDKRCSFLDSDLQGCQNTYFFGRELG